MEESLAEGEHVHAHAYFHFSQPFRGKGEHALRIACKVEAWWLDNLLKALKLEHEVYLHYASRVGVGFTRRLEDVRAAQRHSKERAVLEHVAAEAAARTKCECL